MRITIDTIPLWDAFRQTEMCPFCHLEHKLEELFIDTYLGDSVMEPDVRIEVNATGFCREHYKLLYHQKVSKLGLALMTHTLLKETIAAIHRQIEAIDKSAAGNGTLLKRAAGSRDLGALLEEAASKEAARVGGCVVCRRIEVHMERYFETAVAMWENDSDFRKLFEQSGGFCLPHWGAQLNACKGAYVGKKKLEFIRMVNEMEQKALAELEKDVEWFTQKFDYRNADKPWGNAKTALPRAINRLEGTIVKPES